MVSALMVPTSNHLIQEEKCLLTCTRAEEPQTKQRKKASEGRGEGEGEGGFAEPRGAVGSAIPERLPR